MGAPPPSTYHAYHSLGPPYAPDHSSGPPYAPDQVTPFPVPPYAPDQTASFPYPPQMATPATLSTLKSEQVRAAQIPATSSTPKPKPIRAAQACERCRSRKVKCDEGRPKCKLCEMSGSDCEYPEPPPLRDGPLSRNTHTLLRIERMLATISSRLKRVEARLDIANETHSSEVGSADTSSVAPSSDADDVSSEDEQPSRAGFIDSGPAQTQPPQQFTWNLANGLQVREEVKKRKMTSEERDAYKQTRLRGACEPCRKWRSRCTHGVDAGSTKTEEPTHPTDFESASTQSVSETSERQHGLERTGTESSTDRIAPFVAPELGNTAGFYAPGFVFPERLGGESFAHVFAGSQYDQVISDIRR